MRKLKKQLFSDLFLMACFLLLFGSSPINAREGIQTQHTSPQEKKIEGVVTDKNGDPLIGVNIVVKGTSVGTATDLNGRFSLIMSSSNAPLQFMYVGYTTKELKATTGKPMNVVLSEDTELLDEVVVVGYGTQKKATITGAVDAVSADKLNVSFNTNMQNMLTGKLTGVRVMQRSSEPGKFNTEINIRGMGAPLIVIDGVSSTIDVFNRLAPNEIESVSVLKDAAASVYGMKAGNGVLLITTKKGNNGDGKPAIEYSGNIGFSKVINLNEPMNAYEYATMENEIRKYKLDPEAPLYNSEQMETIRNTKGLNVYNEVMRKANPITNHTVSVSGNVGKEHHVRYFLSANYMKEYGLYKTGDLSYDRYNLRSNISANIGYGLSADLNLSYVSDLNDTPYDGEPWKYIWGLRPLDMKGNVLTSLYANDDPNHLLKLEKFDSNPLAATNQDVVGYVKQQTKNITGHLGLNWNVPFAKGLSAKFVYSFEDYQMTNKRWQKGYSLYEQGTLAEFRINYPTTLKREYDNSLRRNMQASLNYEVSIGKSHNIKLLALFEQQQYDNPGFIGALREFPMEALDEMPAGSAEKQQISAGFPLKEANQGIVGKLNYDYLGKYLLEGSFRYDGSSKFAEGHRWGFFPSVSGGWRISEENFIKNVDALSFINNLKVRASYGKLGDDSGVYYNWAKGYNYPSGQYVFGSSIVDGLADRGFTNNNLTWYTSEIINVGVDFGLWDGMLSGSAEIYRRNRKGLLANRIGSIPGTTGAVMPQENLNSDRTIGWEMLLSHNNKIGDFNYNVSANINIFRTKNIHVEQARATNSFDNWKVNSNNRWNDVKWGHQLGGQIMSESQIKDLLNHQKTSQMALAGVGDYWHYDLNGDGWVNEWDDLEPNLTNTTPKIVYGITLTGEYKGIDLSLVFNGAAKYTVAYEEFLRNPQVFSGQSGALKMWTDRWHQNDNGDWIAGKYPRYREEWGYLPNVWDDSRRHKNASYLRLKNVELGYSLPQNILRKVNIAKLRFYVNAYNVLTFSKIKEMDPEAPGGYMYPMAQNFNFGVNVTF